MPDVQVWMLESFLDRDTRRGVECEHEVQKAQCVWVGVGKELGEGALSHVGEVADVFLSSRRSNSAEGFLVGCTKNVENLVELIDVISALEKWAPSKQLGQNASH